MSQENVEQFREATEAFNRGDVSGFLQFMDPDVQFEPVQAVLEGSYVGLDAVRAWLADLAEHYEDGHFTSPRYAISESGCWRPAPSG